jgi:hypothetical protein
VHLSGFLHVGLIPLRYAVARTLRPLTHVHHQIINLSIAWPGNCYQFRQSTQGLASTRIALNRSDRLVREETGVCGICFLWGLPLDVYEVTFAQLLSARITKADMFEFVSLVDSPGNNSLKGSSYNLLSSTMSPWNGSGIYSRRWSLKANSSQQILIIRWIWISTRWLLI